MIYISQSDCNVADFDAIQSAIDKAHCTNEYHIVVDGGEWYGAEPLRLYDNIHIHLKGARLVASPDCAAVFTTHNDTLPRSRALYGRQKGFGVTGSQDAVISGNVGVFINNGGDFVIDGIGFENCQRAVELAYCNHFRICNLKFDGCDTGVFIGAGSRNGFLFDFCGECRKYAVELSSEQREKIVNYNGRQTENFVIRDIEVQCEDKTVIRGNEVGYIFNCR